MGKRFRGLIWGGGTLLVVGAALLGVVAATRETQYHFLLDNHAEHGAPPRMYAVGLSMTAADACDWYAFKADPKRVQKQMAAELATCGWRLVHGDEEVSVFERLRGGLHEHATFVDTSARRWGTNQGYSCAVWISTPPPTWVQQGTAWLEGKLGRQKPLKPLDLDVFYSPFKCEWTSSSDEREAQVELVFQNRQSAPVRVSISSLALNGYESPEKLPIALNVDAWGTLRRKVHFPAKASAGTAGLGMHYVFSAGTHFGGNANYGISPTPIATLAGDDLKGRTLSLVNRFERPMEVRDLEVWWNGVRVPVDRAVTLKPYEYRRIPMAAPASKGKRRPFVLIKCRTLLAPNKRWIDMKVAL